MVRSNLSTRAKKIYSKLGGLLRMATMYIFQYQVIYYKDRYITKELRCVSKFISNLKNLN